MSQLLPWLFVGDKPFARDRRALSISRVRYVLNATPPRTMGGVANFFEKVGTPGGPPHALCPANWTTDAGGPTLAGKGGWEARHRWSLRGKAGCVRAQGSGRVGKWDMRLSKKERSEEI